MRIAPFLLAALVPLGLQADALGDLRGILSRLQGQEQVKGSAEISRWSQEGEGKKAKVKQSRFQVLVEDGPGGLRLGWTAQQMQAARRESQQKTANPEAPTPNLDGLTGLKASDAAEMVNFADYLLVTLEGAQVLEDRPEPWQGRPARLLHFKPSGHLSASDKEMLKTFEPDLKVWLGPDGVPLAAEEGVYYKGSKFLISFQGTHKNTTTLARVGSRLVAVQSTQEETSSGMGMKNSRKVVTTFSVR